MASQSVGYLVRNPDGIFIDATVGGGGHSLEIIKHLSPAGRLICIDRDPEAVAAAKKILPDQVQIIQARFSKLITVVRPLLDESISGVLFDLGVSSHQIDSAERGFSHRLSGPLDMRMGKEDSEPAVRLLATISERELTRIILEYGEDRQARRIARAIVRYRASSEIADTDVLARIISESVPSTRTKSLSRVFQALRIAVNDEMNEIVSGLQNAFNLLGDGGRLVVISYHSLEDRIVKRFMKSHAAPARDPLNPIETAETRTTGRILTKKPIIPEPEEILENPRARSAKLRAMEKLNTQQS